MRERSMAGEEYMRGFVAGWTAASQALVGAFGAIGSEPGANRGSVALAAGADNPKVAARRRGRPRKSASSVGEQPKRRRGRPRKSETAA
jgi:hypothetical protein